MTFDGKYVYDVMNTIEEAPLRDLVREKSDAERLNANYEDQLRLGSFPTQAIPHSNTDETQQGLRERIDFIFATPGLAGYCTEARVCRTPAELETISDHYPVLAIFSPDANRQRQEQLSLRGRKEVASVEETCRSSPSWMTSGRCRAGNLPKNWAAADS